MIRKKEVLRKGKYGGRGSIREDSRRRLESAKKATSAGDTPTTDKQLTVDGSGDRHSARRLQGGQNIVVFV